MHKLKAILLICLCAIVIKADAQYSEKMRTLRPGYGVNPWTVGQGVLQLHAGYDAQWGTKTLSDAVIANDNRAGNLNLCYGITEKLEIEAFTEVRNDNSEYNHTPSSLSGMSIAAIGARYNIVDKGLNGVSFGIQGVAKLPIQSADYKVRQVLPRVLLLMGWNPSASITLVGNVGVEYDGIKDNPTTLYSLKSQFLINNHMGCYIEAYNTVAFSYPHTGVGAMVYISNSVMVDASVGTGFKRMQKDSYFSLGISARLAGSRTQRHRWVYGEYR